MTPVERIQKMLTMEKNKKQKDAAGIYNPNNVDSAVKVKTLREVIEKLKA